MSEVEIIRYPQIQGINIFYNTVAYRTMHEHKDLELILVLENPLQITLENREYRATEGELLILNPGDLHELNATSASTFLCIQLDTSIFRVGLENIYFDTLNTKLSGRKIRELLDIMQKYILKDEYYELYIHYRIGKVLYELLSNVSSRTLSIAEWNKKNKKTKLLKNLLAYVDENYMHKISLSDFAQKENKSLSYVSHLIKSSINQSFYEYVNFVRLNAACKLMNVPDYRLMDISYDCGFSDYRYFVKAFMERFGKTPKEYRQSLHHTEVWNHQSIHSKERFYTSIESKELTRKFLAIYKEKD